MKQQFFVAALFAVSLYWMYVLYAPFLLIITIAILLAISTSEVQHFFERYLKSRLFASVVSSLLLAGLFFAPLGYFLTTLTMKLNTLDPQMFYKIEMYIRDFITNPPEYLLFLKPYISDGVESLNIHSLTANTLAVTAKIGAFSAGFVKNAFLVVIFYFFAQYNGSSISTFLKRIVHMSLAETDILVKDVSSVMSVVFYSILANAMFQGVLFGVAISSMGHNGLLFGIMYGFASLIPVIGGVLMWVPFVVYELAMGNSANALFISLYSIIVISIIADTLVKPLIIKEINTKLLEDDSMRMHELVIFFSIIAGLTTFGFWGMILGPAITAFFLTILKLFEARSEELLT
jgi:predicted PurR-regulated permease PerM